MKIAKLIGPIIVTEDLSTENTQKTEFSIEECTHKERGVKIPQSIYSNIVKEYCKDCGEITRVSKF